MKTGEETSPLRNVRGAMILACLNRLLSEPGLAGLQDFQDKLSEPGFSGLQDFQDKRSRWVNQRYESRFASSGRSYRRGCG